MTTRSPRSRSVQRVWLLFSNRAPFTFPRAPSARGCLAASPKSMRGTAKAISQRRSSGTRILPGQGSSSYSPPDHPLRCLRCGRSSRASVSVSSLIGEDAAAANLVKLAANVLTATTLECMGEVLALMRKGGVDGHLAFDVLTNSLFDSRVHKSYGQKIVDGRYIPPGLTAPLAIKDLRLALVEAERAAVPMPAAALVHDRLVAMVARGWADLDWSALGLLAAVDAGLDDGRSGHPST